MKNIIDKTIPLADCKEHHIVVAEPLGTAGGFHIYIDNYFCGQIVKSPEGWAMHLNSSSKLAVLLTSDDIGAIMDVVNEIR